MGTMKTLGGLFSLLLAGAALAACSGEAGGANDVTARGQDEALSATQVSAGFACGAALTCDPATQYCRHVVGGVYRPGYAGTFSCESAPVACTNAVSCACLHARTSGPTRCTESNGDVTVTLLTP